MTTKGQKNKVSTCTESLKSSRHLISYYYGKFDTKTMALVTSYLVDFHFGTSTSHYNKSLMR